MKLITVAVALFAAGCAQSGAPTKGETTESLGSTQQALTASIAVSGFANLYQNWQGMDGYSTGGAQPAVSTGINACSGGTVTVTSTGCAVDDGPNCTGPNGYADLFRGLPVYALIGAWSTDPSVLTADTAASAPFFVGADATLTAPTGAGPYYLFLGENDGNFGDNGAGYTSIVSSDDSCGCSDMDSDGVCDDDDNCPDVENPYQQDCDGDGVGNACEQVEVPVCASFPETGCYWMENFSGNFCWIPANGASDFGQCFALDSCDGGLGQSGGGCYKWADGSDGARYPW
jgi:hypothetical protein